MDNVLEKLDLNFCGNSKHKITVSQLFNMKNAVLLDVRYEEETRVLKFDLSTLGIPTLNIPLHEIPDRINEIPRNKTVVTFCSHGTRAAWAYLYLLWKGYEVLWLSATASELAGTISPKSVLKE